MKTVRLYEIGDSDIVFGRGQQFTHRSCYKQFRQLLIQRKAIYRKHSLSFRKNLIEEIIELAFKDGMAFFQFCPAENLAEEMTRTQLINKIRQMYTDIFKIDDGKSKKDKEGSRRSSAKYRTKRCSPATFARPVDENPQSESFVFDSQQAESAMKRACHSEMVPATNPTQGSFPMRNGENMVHNVPVLPNTPESCFAFLNESLSTIEKKQVAGIKTAREHLQKLLEEQEDVTTAQTKLSELSRQPELCHGIAPDELLDSIVQCLTGGGGPVEFALNNSSLHNQQHDSHSMLQQNEELVRFNDSCLRQAPTDTPNHPVRRVSLVSPNTKGVSQQRQYCPDLKKYALAVFQWKANNFESQRDVAETSPVESVRINMLERHLTVTHLFAPKPAVRPAEQVVVEKNSIAMFSPQTVPYSPTQRGRTEQVNGGETSPMETNWMKNLPRTHPKQMGVELSGNGRYHQLHSKRESLCQTPYLPFVLQTRESVRTSMPKPYQFWTPDQATGAPDMAHGVNVSLPVEQSLEELSNSSDDGLLQKKPATKEHASPNHWNPAVRETSVPCQTPSSSLASELLAQALRLELG